MVDEYLEQLNKYYPDSYYVKINKYDPEKFKDRDYNSKYDDKSPMNKWQEGTFKFEDAKKWVEEGGRIGWRPPAGVCVIDIDGRNEYEEDYKPGFTNPQNTAEIIKKILDEKEILYSYMHTFHGTHFIFRNEQQNIKTVQHVKCALNLDVDSRANESGYIILPPNDPYRSWGTLREFVDEVPFWLKPVSTLSKDKKNFVGMGNGDGRNDSLFRWKGSLIASKAFSEKECAEACSMINQYIFATPMEAKELSSVVRETKTQSRDNSPKPNKLNLYAEEFLSQYNLISYGDRFYRFTGQHYKKLEDIEVEQLIHQSISPDLSSSQRKEIMKFLILKTQVSIDKFDAEPFQIACANGLLDITAPSLRPASAADINTIYIPWNYNSDPQPSPLIDSFMNTLSSTRMGNGDVIPNPIKKQFLYEIAGYCLLKKNIYAKFFLFQGKAGSGKSTFQELIRKLVGYQNCSEVSLSDFDQPYSLATLEGKLVNLDDDAADRKTLENTGKFKSTIAGNAIQVRQIFTAPITIVPFVTCIVNCNKLPRIKDDTGGLYRRMIILELSNVIRNPDPLFMSKITSLDMEYFLFKSVEAINHVYKTGKFSIMHSDQELLAKFKCRQSSMNEWIYEANIQLRDIHNAPCYKLYNEFVAWAKDNNYQSMPSIFTFKEDIVSLYNVDVASSENETIGGKKTSIFKRRGNLTEEDMNFNPFMI